MLKVPERYRIKGYTFTGLDAQSTTNGAFRIPLVPGKVFAFAIASIDGPWEHVSVHISEKYEDRTPTWDEMCRIKDLFWADEDMVLQFHPPKSEYVNLHPHTLHLWRPKDEALEVPSPTRL